EALNMFKISAREYGLDNILNSRRPSLVIVSEIPFADGLNGSYASYSLIIIDKKIVDNYIKAKDILKLNGIENLRKLKLSEENKKYIKEIYLFFETIFHEKVHDIREVINKYYTKNLFMALALTLLGYILPPNYSAISLALLLMSYYYYYKLLSISELLKGKSTEEIVTTTISNVLLSEIFSEELVKNMLIEEYKIDPIIRHEATIKIEYNNLLDKIKNRIYRLVKRRKITAYEIGAYIAYILLHLNKEKRIEFINKLMKVYSNKELINVIKEIEEHIEKDNYIYPYHQKVMMYLNGEKGVYNTIDNKEPSYFGSFDKVIGVASNIEKTK
ncbi:MAG: hypothetical protein ACPLX8_00605, partial [Nanopusillaceae archaeon]